MRGWPDPSTPRCLAPRRALSWGALAAIFWLSACGYIPRPVEGVPPGAPWEALPLRKWLAEDRAEPRAMAFCAPPECGPALAVAVIRLTGQDARATGALLADPDRLARALRAPKEVGQSPKTLVAVERLKEEAFSGFLITLEPKNGGKRPAHGLALGRWAGDALDVVLVIGDDEQAVRKTAREVAALELSA